jgi:hypothetical protein
MLSKKYKLRHPNAVTVVNRITPELLTSLDAVAGTYSTMMHEMVFYGIPLLLLKTSFDHGHVLQDDRLVHVVTHSNFETIIPYLTQHASSRDVVWPPTQSLESTLELLTASHVSL